MAAEALKARSAHSARRTLPLASGAAACDASRVSARAEGATVLEGFASTPTNTVPATTASAPFVTPSDLAWRVIGLLNLYRMLVPLVLLAVQALSGSDLRP